MTTIMELRIKDFSEFIFAPGTRKAGSLHVDDGVSIVQEKSMRVTVEMQFAEGKLSIMVRLRVWLSQALRISP